MVSSDRPVMNLMLGTKVWKASVNVSSVWVPIPKGTRPTRDNFQSISPNWEGINTMLAGMRGQGCQQFIIPVSPLPQSDFLLWEVEEFQTFKPLNTSSKLAICASWPARVPHHSLEVLWLALVLHAGVSARICQSCIMIEASKQTQK